jgi:hyperosmotically inducible periplasmic protein
VVHADRAHLPPALIWTHTRPATTTKETNVNTTHNVIAAALFGVALAAGCTHMGDASVSQVSDSQITTKVKSKFVADNAVGADDIHVDTYKGTVVLTGFARSAYEIDRAGNIAWHTEGVKLVRNDIHLTQ